MTPEEMLAKKQAQQRTLRDSPEDATLRAALGRDNSVLINAPSEIAECDRTSQLIERWIADCQRWHATFKQEFDVLPPIHERTHEQAKRAVALLEAIQQIETGVRFVHGAALLSPLLREKICETYPPSWDMLAPLDPWRVGFGSLSQAQARLDELQRKRALAQSQLDEAMKERGYLVTS